MNDTAIQDLYPESMSYCYGCGRLNDHGLKIKSYWDESTGETIATYLPRHYHIAIPGYVYGGLIASLIDCHGTGSAAIAAYREAGLPMDSESIFRFVTGTLTVKYLRPTPLGAVLELRGKIKELKSKKITVEVKLSVNDEICAEGEVVAIQIPDSMISDNS